MKRNYYIAALLLPALLLAGMAQATDAGTGIFSVSATKKVQFATANETGGATANSLFQWTDRTTTTYGEWHVLTSSEWSYLLASGRTAAATKNSLGTVDGQNGLIILPDEWINPLNRDFNPTYTSEGFGANTYSTAEWTAMELSGAVFLPCKGYSSNGTTVLDGEIHGAYWSANSHNESDGKCMRFNNVVINDNNFADKSLYYSLRYVREIKVLDENDEQSAFDTKFASAKTKDYTAIHRTLYKDGYFNTLCLPFSVPQISNSPLAGATVYYFTGADVTGGAGDEELHLHLSRVTNDRLEIGVPYLIQWANTDEVLTYMRFENVAWDTDTTAAADPGDGSVNFHGFYYRKHVNGNTNPLAAHYNFFVGAENTLYWPDDGDDNNAKMKGFRAYFYITPGGGPSSAPVRCGMRASFQITSTEDAVTNLEELFNQSRNGNQKYFQNGKIVLVIDGETYSIGGEKL